MRSRAAVALAFSVQAALAGCEHAPMPTPPAPRPVARVAISAAPDTAGVVGATLQLTATAYDSAGAVVEGAGIVWRALTSSKGRVDAAGTVTLGPSGGDFWVTATEPGSGQVDTVSLHAARAGEVRWSYPIAQGAFSNVGGPALGPDGTVYALGVPIAAVEQTDLYALSPRGALRWSRRLDRTAYNMHLVGPDGTVYVVGRTLYALDPAAGVPRWTAGISTSIIADFISAALAANGVLVAAAANRALAVRAATGDTVWLGPEALDYGWFLPPSLAGNTAWIKNTGDSLYGFDLGTGAMGRGIADVDSGNISYGVGAVPVGARLYLPLRFRFAAFDTTGVLQWLTPGRGSGVSEPVVDGLGRLFLQTQDGLMARDPQTGVELWRRLAGIPRWTWHGGPALAQGGTIYCAAELGFYAYNTSGTLLWSYQTTEGGTSPVPFTGAPAIAPDGTIYTYTDTRVYAFWGLYPPEPNSPWPMWRHDAQRTGRAR